MHFFFVHIGWRFPLLRSQLCKQTNYVCANIRNKFLLLRVNPSFTCLLAVVSACLSHFFLTFMRINVEIPKRCRTTWVISHILCVYFLCKVTPNQRLFLYFNLSSLVFAARCHENGNIHNIMTLAGS